MEKNFMHHTHYLYTFSSMISIKDFHNQHSIITNHGTIINFHHPATHTIWTQNLKALDNAQLIKTPMIFHNNFQSSTFKIQSLINYTSDIQTIFYHFSQKFINKLQIIRKIDFSSFVTIIINFFQSRLFLMGFYFQKKK